MCAWSSSDLGEHDPLFLFLIIIAIDCSCVYICVGFQNEALEEPYSNFVIFLSFRCDQMCLKENEECKNQITNQSPNLTSSYACVYIYVYI